MGWNIGKIAQVALPVIGTAAGAVMGGPAGAMIGGSIGGGVGSMFGEDEYSKNVNATNAANIGMAREQMAFQERMSSTAYQRSVQDMQKAGINPMTAAGGGGASTPSGAMPTVQNPGAAGPQMVQMAVSNAKDMLNTMQVMRESNARIRNTNADTEIKRGPQWLKSWVDSDIADQQEKLLEKQNFILGLEKDVAAKHPEAMGWLGALASRGVNLSSAAGAAGTLGALALP